VKTDNAEQERILFMDDEEPIRELGGTILRRSGYDVSVASDGSEAVGLYERALREGRPYSLVILDLTIPGGMGGGPTLEALLKLDPKVKAIVSSGYSNDATLSNYRAYGFQGMVSKPYDGADLTLAVENVLKGGRA
jgi:CheY-like chemotaxis protein